MTIKLDDSKDKLLRMYGGSAGAMEMAEILGVRRQLIQSHRDGGKILGLQVGKYCLYPKWQFGMKGVDVALMALKDFDPWMQLAFFVQPKDSLDGKTPIDC